MYIHLSNTRYFQGGPVSDEEAVRIFVEFERMESAIKGKNSDFQY